MRTYHVGIYADHKNRYTPQHEITGLVIQARRNVDNLSEELMTYYGEREITKKQLYLKKNEILAGINKQWGTHYKRIRVD